MRRGTDRHTDGRDQYTFRLMQAKRNKEGRSGAYLVDDRALSAADRLQPSFAQRRRFLGYAVEVPVVVMAAVARPELAVGKSARRRHRSAASLSALARSAETHAPRPCPGPYKGIHTPKIAKI